MKFFRTYIEITNNCGLSCSFCPSNSNKKLYMDIEIFDKILKNLHSKEIALHVAGDPLLNKKLGQYFDLAQKYKFSVILTTNGFFINKHDFATLLHASIKQINISLDSFNNNRTRLSIDEYLYPIFELIDFKLEQNTNHIINLRLWNLNADNSENSYNNLIFQKIENHFNIKINKNNIKHRHNIRVAKKTLIHFHEYFEWPSLSNPIYRDSPCLGLNSQIAILVDGRVVPCCLDLNANVNLGNINQNSLVEILKNSSKIAKNLKNGTPTEELCKRCSYRLRFTKKG